MKSKDYGEETPQYNSAFAICNYCGDDYNAAYGNHICDQGNLKGMIADLKAEGDTKEADRIGQRLEEVNEFWRKNPNFGHSVSKRMPA